MNEEIKKINSNPEVLAVEKFGLWALILMKLELGESVKIHVGKWTGEGLRKGFFGRGEIVSNKGRIVQLGPGVKPGSRVIFKADANIYK